MKEAKIRDRLITRGASSLEDSIAYAIETEFDSLNFIPSMELYCKYCRNNGHREHDCERKKTNAGSVGQLINVLRAFGSNGNRDFRNSANFNDQNNRNWNNSRNWNGSRDNRNNNQRNGNNFRNWNNNNNNFQNRNSNGNNGQRNFNGSRNRNWSSNNDGNNPRDDFNRNQNPRNQSQNPRGQSNSIIIQAPTNQEIQPPQQVAAESENYKG